MTRKLEVFPGQLEIDYAPEHISSSQRSWLDCRRYWALSSVQRLRPRDMAMEAKLEFGTALHTILGSWYATPPKERVGSALAHLAEITVQNSNWPNWMIEMLEPKLMQAVGRFNAKFGTDNIEMEGVEYQLSAKLPGSSREYLGFVDWYYWDNDVLIVEDLKTSQTSIDPSRYTLFNPKADDYLWAVKQMIPKLFKDKKQREAEVVFSYLFLTPDRAWRVRVPRHDFSHAGEELAQIAREQDTLPIVPNYGYACGRCRYQSLCTAFLTGRPVRDIISADFVSGRDQEE